ncbi:MAG: Gfo/Idh/MocA family oxidoreductase [Candidatus Cloacimonetes bacterium]|nr:Gfo/Idh/MocA family oxidoreductase [Candidatus Cloacimonadota bacterium]
MNKTAFGIVGCGYQTVRNMAPAMAKCEQVYMAGCYDNDPAKAKALAQNHGIRAYDSLTQLLEDTSIDAIYVATPTVSHQEICLAAAAAGKHILCEKSLAMDLGQAQNMVDACKARGLSLVEGFMYRHHAQHKYVQEQICGGELGKPWLFEAWFGFPALPQTDFRRNKNLGGGVILDAGAYTVHAARNFFGREPRRIVSVIHHDENGLDIQGRVLMDFGDQQSAQLAFGMDNGYKNSYSIWCEKGEIWLKRAFSMPASELPVCFVKTQGLLREHQLAPCDHFLEELKAFCGLDDAGREAHYLDIIGQAEAMSQIAAAGSSNTGTLT